MNEPLSPAQSTRAAELYDRHAEGVSERLGREFHWVHDDEVVEAVVEAILAVAHDSRDFDPTRGTFEAYLYGHARNHLRSRRRSEKRLKAREEKKAATAVTTELAADPTLVEEALEDAALVKELFETLAHTETERAALTLWMQGIDSPADVARHLGFGTDAAAVRQATTLLSRLRQRIHREKMRRMPDSDPEDSP